VGRGSLKIQSVKWDFDSVNPENGTWEGEALSGGWGIRAYRLVDEIRRMGTEGAVQRMGGIDPDDGTLSGEWDPQFLFIPRAPPSPLGAGQVLKRALPKRALTQPGTAHLCTAHVFTYRAASPRY